MQRIRFFIVAHNKCHVNRLSWYTKHLQCFFPQAYVSTWRGVDDNRSKFFTRLLFLLMRATATCARNTHKTQYNTKVCDCATRLFRPFVCGGFGVPVINLVRSSSAAHSLSLSHTLFAIRSFHIFQAIPQTPTASPPLSSHSYVCNILPGVVRSV